MKKFLLLFYITSVVCIYSQDLNSLYNKYLQIKNISTSVKAVKTESSNKPIKCGFGIINQVKSNYNKFTAAQKLVLDSLSPRPVTDTSIVSPSGKFRIHFFKSGSNKPVYDVNEFAKAADSAYNYEVNYLGYPAPPGDSSKTNRPGNPDNKYDIYILNLAGNY